MRCYLSVICVLSALIAASHAAPMPQSGQSDPNSQAATSMRIVNTFNEKISLLRQYCPQLFKVIDNVIQNVTSTAFRVIGRVLLQQGGLGGGGGGGSEGGAGRVSVVLPDFGDDDDDEDDEEETAAATSNTSGGSTPALTALEASSSVSTSGTSTTTTDSSVSTRDQNSVISTSSTLPATTTTTEAAVVAADDRRNDVDSDRDDKDDVEITISDARDRTNPLSLTTAAVPVVKEKDVEVATPDTLAAPLFTSPASNVDLVDVNDIRVRTRRAADTADDQTAAASGNSVAADVAAPNPADDLANVEDDADRDKRFLPFGGSIGGSASAGSGGGSGNFLFDIIRLIAGSGATEASDEQDHAPIGPGGVAEIDVAKATDAYTEGVPGPITRLFVLANRGLANLVQDLILRLAQTSERIVNFKARLVTALI